MTTTEARDEAATATSISARLREHTDAAHQSAERARFLDALLRGRLSIDAWAGLLDQYSFIYRALEETAGRIRENHPVCELLSVELNRSDAIAADLKALAPRRQHEPLGMLPATREYVDRILATKDAPERYLAHHYTRYLGDLSGGQAMRVMLDRAYGLPDEEASFFRFEEIPALVPFKRHYRETVDALDIDEASIQRLLDEASRSFEFNERMFAELDDVFAPATTPAPAPSSEA